MLLKSLPLFPFHTICFGTAITMNGLYFCFGLVESKHLEKPKNWGLWLPPKMIAFIQAYGKFMSSLHRSVVKFPIFLTSSWEQICLNCALCLSVLAISLHVCVCVWSNCEVMWLACVTLRSAALAPYHYHTFTLLYSEKVRCATFFSPSILLA